MELGPIATNAFLLWEENGDGEAVLIDAPPFARDTVEEVLDREKLKLEGIWLTHGHWDHIQAVPAIREAGYEVGVTSADAEMLPSYDYLLEDQSVIEVGRLRLHTIMTPGHTPGSICFRLENSPILFSGDTLFPGGPGTTEFEGGNFDQIIESIDSRLFSQLPPETLVLPGHGTDTTIANESPSLDEWAARGW